MESVYSTTTIEKKTKPFYKTLTFYIEMVIFLISVVGALLVSFNLYLYGFILWLFSNTFSIAYFIFQKQYPLVCQQVVFLVTTIIGVYNNV